MKKGKVVKEPQPKCHAVSPSGLHCTRSRHRIGKHQYAVYSGKHPDDVRPVGYVEW